MQLDWQTLINQTIKDEFLRNAYVWEPFAKGSSNAIFLGRIKPSKIEPHAKKSTCFEKYLVRFVSIFF